MQLVYTGSRVCPLAYADRVCSRYQATMASRAFSAASWEPSASALEPSPNSYFVLPVASRIIRWAKMGRGVHGQRRAGGHSPPSATEGCVVARGTLRHPPHTPSSALRQGPDGEWRGATDLWVGMQSCASWVRATTRICRD